MTRINTNVPSLMAALYLNRNTDALNLSLQRLSTGLRINSAKDDPSGITVTDVMGGQINGINAATQTAQRASNLMATADGSLSSVADLLLEIKQLGAEAANSGALTPADIAAKQLQVDNDVAAIDQIISTATFGSQKLLDGSLGYQTAGVDGAALQSVTVNSAPVSSGPSGTPVQVTLTTAAKTATLTFPHATVASDLTVNFTGPDGAQQLSFTAGTTSAQLVAAINGATGQTGLSASYLNGNPAQGVVISTAAYGSAATMSATVTTGNAADFALQDAGGHAATTAQGVDLGATVNGDTVVGDGLKLHYVGAGLDLTLEAQQAWNAVGPGASTSFDITSDGAVFQLGSDIGTAQQASFGLPAMDSAHLGDAAVGFISQLASGGSNSLSSGNLTAFSQIVDAASSQVADLRSRIGSFQDNTLKMATNSLQQSLTSVSSARSQILDTDFAVETANVARLQVLASAAQSSIALANQVPQYVLNLLKA